MELKKKNNKIKNQNKRIVRTLMTITWLKFIANPVMVFADKKSDGGDGTETVLSGIESLKTLVLGCVSGVGVIFLAWGLLDFGTAYSSHDSSQQSQAIKKVIGGLIMIAVPQLITLLGGS